MTALTLARGEILPGFILSGINGSSVDLESCRGQTNLVVVFAGSNMDNRSATALLDELVVRTEELTFEAARVLFVAAGPNGNSRRDRWPFPVLVDDGAHIHRHMGATDAEGRPAPAVFVTDRFREIYAVYLLADGSALPGAEEILDWLRFINIQCPECGVPEWPIS